MLQSITFIRGLLETCEGYGGSCVTIPVIDAPFVYIGLALIVLVLGAKLVIRIIEALPG